MVGGMVCYVRKVVCYVIRDRLYGMLGVVGFVGMLYMVDCVAGCVW